MASVVGGVVTSAHMTMRTVADQYLADSVSVLKPSAYEVGLFRVNPAAAATYWYLHNVHRYLSSIATGISDAVSQAKLLHGRCPQALLILAGYSQGAMVMHQAELQIANGHEGGLLQQIAGTLLLGDGDRIPYTAAKQFGTSKARAEGVRTWLRRNSHQDVWDSAAAANICNAGDMVCDFSVSRIFHAPAAIKIHTSYAVRRKDGSYTYDPALTSAATWIAQIAVARFASGNSTNWAQLGGNAAHTGLSTSLPVMSAAMAGQLHQIWSTPIAKITLTDGTSSPVVAAGIVYLLVPADVSPSSGRGHLRAFSAATGRLLWAQPIGGAASCTDTGDIAQTYTCEPTVAGNVVLTSDESTPVEGSPTWVLKAFAARTGKALWTLKTGFFPKLAAVGNTVYVVTDLVGSQIRAVSAATGTVLWSKPYSGLLTTVPAVADGHLYVVSLPSSGPATLRIFNTASGVIQVTRSLPADVSGAPPVVDGKHILLTVDPTYDTKGRVKTPAHLLALDATTGVKDWEDTLSWVTFGEPGRPCSTGPLVVVGDALGQLTAINSDNGHQAWLEKPRNPPYLNTTFCAVSGNLLVTGNANGPGSAGLINIPDGKLIRTLTPRSAEYLAGTPAIVGGRIYVAGTSDLVAFGAQ